MKLLLHVPALLLAAAALFVPPAQASPRFGVKTRANVNLSFDLQATPVAPAGATGEATIQIKPIRGGGQITRLKLQATGLPAGSYSVDATNAAATTVHLGDFAIEPIVDDPATPADESLVVSTEPAEVRLVLAPEIDALKIATLSISNATPEVLLEGGLSATEGRTRFFANVRVIAPPVLDPAPAAGTPKARKVHGHLLLNTVSADGAETKRHVLWVAHGGPASTDLTILVDGVAHGTVTSTAKGKVKFASLPAEVALPTINKIEIVDTFGVVVMQATLVP